MIDGSNAEHTDSHHAPALTPDDAAALDALIEAGYDPALVPEQHRAGAERVGRILGLLASTEHADDRLVDATLARLGPTTTGNTPIGLLCADDRDALDALVCEGFRPARVASGLRPRADRLATLLGTLDPAPVAGDGGSDALIETTLARVQREIDAEQRSLNIESEGARRRRFALPDLVSVAAILLVGVGILWPVGSRFAAEQERAACQANLFAAATGFGQYASDYRDALPVASDAPAGNRWWDVGSVRTSNSANLFLLVRSGHAAMPALACPGNPDAVFEAHRGDAVDWPSLVNVSYSYQNMFAPERPNWTSAAPHVVIIDRSPVVLRARRGEVIYTLENSPNHGGLGAGRGQNVLMSDGAVRWLRTPVLESGDNVWLPRGLERLLAGTADPLDAAPPLDGTESPEGADDAFVGP